MKRTELSTSQPYIYVEETPDKVIVHKYEKTKSPGVFFGISGSWVSLAIIIIGCVFFFFQLKPHNGNSQIESSPQIQQNENILNWEETGYFFPYSDEYLIKEQDIVFLASDYGYSEHEIIQYAINEIYARNHYQFSNSKWLSFYSQYDWYNGYYTMEEAREHFNAVEAQNIVILTELRRSYSE